jgi:hypothetical protein
VRNSTKYTELAQEEGSKNPTCFDHEVSILLEKSKTYLIAFKAKRVGGLGWVD